MLLVTLYRDHPFELEADLQQTFGVNLRDIETEGVAHVATLSSQLGSGSRVAGTQTKYGDWSIDQQLLAGLLNQLKMIAYGMGGGKGERPELIGEDDETETRHFGESVDIQRINEIYKIGGTNGK